MDRIVKHLKMSVKIRFTRSWMATYGGLLLRSVFRMIGTRVISLTS